MSYKTLEEQIRALWRSRGLEVIEEEFKAVGDGTFQWIIKAKEVKKT